MGLKEDLLKVVEAEVKKQVEEHCGELVAAVLAKIEEAIPGGLDNAVLEALKPQLSEIAKAQLLKLADKISADV